MFAVSFLTFLHGLLHPFRGVGYQFYSGIAGSFLMPSGLWAAVLFIARRHSRHHAELCEEVRDGLSRRGGSGLKVFSGETVGVTTSSDPEGW